MIDAPAASPPARCHQACCSCCGVLGDRSKSWAATHGTRAEGVPLDKRPQLYSVRRTRSTPYLALPYLTSPYPSLCRGRQALRREDPDRPASRSSSLTTDASSGSSGTPVRPDATAYKLACQIGLAALSDGIGCFGPSDLPSHCRTERQPVVSQSCRVPRLSPTLPTMSTASLVVQGAFNFTA